MKKKNCTLQKKTFSFWTTRFIEQYQAYKKAPDITRKRIYLETMEEILPDINKVVMENKKGGSGVLPILPLGRNSILGGNK